MAIKVTHTNPATQVSTVSHTHEHRVLEVRSYQASRNHSDTLDYTDFAMTTVTEALVYRGRRAPKWSFLPVSETNPLVDVPLADRFTWLDCTNLFTWRGQDHMVPTVDRDALALDALLAEDYLAWLDIEAAKQAAARRALDEKLAAEQWRIANLPKVGVQMTVAKGKKVKVGTTGTVAWISYKTGGVLLKDDARWQDRNEPGTWVNPEHLVLRSNYVPAATKAKGKQVAA